MLKKMKLKNLSTFVHPHPMLVLILQLVPTILWLDHNRLNLLLSMTTLVNIVPTMTYSSNSNLCSFDCITIIISSCNLNGSSPSTSNVKFCGCTTCISASTGGYGTSWGWCFSTFASTLAFVISSFHKFYDTYGYGSNSKASPLGPTHGSLEHELCSLDFRLCNCVP